MVTWVCYGLLALEKKVELSSRIQCLTFDHQNVAVQHCWCFVTAWLTLAWKDLKELPSNDGQVNVTSSFSRMKNYSPFLKKPSTVKTRVSQHFSTFKWTLLRIDTPTPQVTQSHLTQALGKLWGQVIQDRMLRITSHEAKLAVPILDDFANLTWLNNSWLFVALLIMSVLDSQLFPPMMEICWRLSLENHAININPLLQRWSPFRSLSKLWRNCWELSGVRRRDTTTWPVITLPLKARDMCSQELQSKGENNDAAPSPLMKTQSWCGDWPSWKRSLVETCWSGISQKHTAHVPGWVFCSTVPPVPSSIAVYPSDCKLTRTRLLLVLLMLLNLYILIIFQKGGHFKKYGAVANRFKCLDIAKHDQSAWTLC